MPFKKKISEIFSLDLRSLALFRICLGLTIIYDLLSRAFDLTAHYSDAGVLPCDVQIERHWLDGFFSLHVLSGSAFYQGTLFAVAGLFAVAFVFGYHTRLVSIASWFLLTSLHSRNSLVLTGGDAVFRLLLFWSMFLPLGSRWSLDNLRRKQSENPSHFFSSIATFCFLIQIAEIYIFNFLEKSAPVWRETFEAVYYALNIDYLTSDFGRYLLEFPHFLKVLTAGTLILEGIFPYLIFMPWKNSFFKFAVAISFITFHLGLFFSMELGIFPFVCIFMWFAVLPQKFWEILLRPSKISKFIETFTIQVRNHIPRLSLLNRGQNTFWDRPMITKISNSFFNSLALMCIISITAWNFWFTDLEKYQELYPESLDRFIYALRLDQRWNMFSQPSQNDGWYVIPATLKNGSQVDLFRGGSEVSWEKPTTQPYLHRNKRWRKYMRNIGYKENKPERKYLSDYLHNQWNKGQTPEKKIVSLEIFRMIEKTLPDYKKSEVKKMKLWTQTYQD